MKKQNKLNLVIIAVLVLVAAYFCYDYFSEKPETVSYSTFIDALNQKNISTVEIAENEIIYSLNSESDLKKSYKT